MRRVTCTLRVARKDGRSIAGARLAVTRASEAVPELAYVADAQGQVRLGLPPGEIELRIFVPDGKAHGATLNVVDAPDRTYDVVLDA